MTTTSPGWIESAAAIAVLPSLFTVGPLALLAWLFPATFGSLAIFLRRGIVFCTVLSTISTLYLSQAALRAHLAGTWWATPSAFWCGAAAVAGAGLIWTLGRARRPSAAATTKPGLGAMLILALLSVSSIVIVVQSLGPASAQVWHDLLPFCLAVWVGFICALWQRRRSVSPGGAARLFSPERSMLMVLTLACCSEASTVPPARSPLSMEIAWAFEPVERGAIVSTPLVSGGRVYIGTIRDAVDRSRGAVYAVDRNNGKAVWCFNDEGRMLNMFSTPCLADGRLYIGEGMHADFACKLYCLNAADGHKLWEFPTANHIESSPTVANGSLYVGAGDDGVYCLDARTGKQRWNFREGLHIDASPVVAGGYVYASSGVSRRCRITQILCLDATTGNVRWRKDTDLPGWGSPLVVGNRIYFGLGNGRLLASAAPPEKPAGALLCVDATSGDTLFRFSTGDGVLARAAADATRVYFTSRDGFCYALDQASGDVAWKFPMDGPAVTTPALAGDHLYVVPTQGPLLCLDAATGALVASFDIRKWNGTDVRVLSSPTAQIDPGLEPPLEIVYFGTEVRGPIGSAAVLYAVRSPH